MDKNRYLIELSSSTKTDFGRVDFAHQNHEQRVFSAIWELEGQVNGGGFSSYFENEEPDAVSFAPIALRAIGATKCADIVDRALQISTQDSAGNIDNLLQALDDEFLEYPDNLTDLLYEFVASHAETFGKIPDC